MARRNPLLTEGEVAEIFGVTSRTVRQWAHRGLLTPLRMGGVTRYRAAEMSALIERPTPASEEVSA
jgi:excisionase family DNA binding protein